MVASVMVNSRGSCHHMVPLAVLNAILVTTGLNTEIDHRFLHEVKRR